MASSAVTPAHGAQDAPSSPDLRGQYQAFFEEAVDNLDAMEQRLLRLNDAQPADDEALNAVFRCAHSLKGGAATFGLADVTALAHRTETLLDKLRRHALAPAPAVVDVLLQAGDALRAQLAHHQGGGAPAVDTLALLASISALCDTPVAGTDAAPACPVRVLQLTVGPLSGADADAGVADALAGLFHEIPDLGSIEPLDLGRDADGLRRFKLRTASSDDELIGLFGFYVSCQQVRLAPLSDDAAGAAAAPRIAHAVAASASAPSQASTVRVPVDKVDQLINLVGELRITQARLARAGQDMHKHTHKNKSEEPGRTVLPQPLRRGLADLERDTLALQQAVLGIRMMPVSLVFNRFPRMLRDLAGRLGKQIELVQVGAATELDKSLLEKIADPLTHLVRNSCDHGIELPTERLARGKPAHGTLRLSAQQRGGGIVIEVRDDGRGLSRARLIANACQRGIAAHDGMSDGEVHRLVFAPGFSTAAVVSDVSGRGVGMDVVRKGIAALGGTVEIESVDGHGMAVQLRLPLTLALIDGLCVGVGSECYIVPLASVVACCPVLPDTVTSSGGDAPVALVRGARVPVLCLAQRFGVVAGVPGGAGLARHPTSASATSRVLVVVEADGARVALLVDALLGQQQVVAKSLERNYRKVDDVSGATVLADGRVALILDAGALVRRSQRAVSADVQTARTGAVH